MKKYNMHLIMNTHWDREWRWSFHETQRHLIEAMDSIILTMENDDRYRSFHTDSQVAMVDDYLSACPEQRGRVIKLVHDGRLMIGPWYTLPAEYLVDGESMVRNLIIGHQIGSDLGGVMKAAYNIFSWGQISQLPQIYRQFGMDTILFYRGIDKTALETLEFWWDAPDGSRCLGVTFGEHIRLNFWQFVYKPFLFGMSTEGYDRTGNHGFLFNLCDERSKDRNHHLVNQETTRDYSHAQEGMQKLIASLGKSSTDELLFLQGFDLENPDPTVLNLVDYINENLDFGTIIVDTLPNYIHALRLALDGTGMADRLPVFQKEMLEVEKTDQSFGPLYPGVFSSRMPIKLANDKSETTLIHVAEPLAVMAMQDGCCYPQGSLKRAWKTLCQNQQHDGIGGCHVDRVTLATLERYREIDDICEVVILDSLSHLVENIDFSDLVENGIGIVVFNSLSFCRSDIVNVILDFGLQDGEMWHGGLPPLANSLEIIGPDGNPVLYEIHEQVEESIYVTREYGSNTSFPSMRYRIAFEAKDIPPLGYSRYTARQKKGVQRPLENIATGPNSMENEYYQVRINFDGSIDIEDKRNGELYSRLHYFEDEGEVGGPLIHIKPTTDSVSTTFGRAAECELIHSGPLHAVFRVTHRWMLPKGVGLTAKRQIPNPYRNVEHGEFYRLDDKDELRIISEIELKKNSKCVLFRTRVDNNLKNHRLRVIFPTSITTNEVHADSPFDVVERDINLPDSSGWFEEALRYYPSNSFVLLKDMQKRGLQVVQCGIPEYEIKPKENCIAMTLLRCFEVAGGGKETFRQEPLAQCLGPHDYTYAIFLYNENPQHAQACLNARGFKVPFRVAQCTSHQGSRKETRYSFLDPGSNDVVVSGIKRAEDSDCVIMRCFNPGNQLVSSSIRVAAIVCDAMKINLDESETERLNHTDHEIEIHVKPKTIQSTKISCILTGERNKDDKA